MMINRALLILAIFTTFNFISCKITSKKLSITHNNCYEIKNGYVFMNFYNNSNKDIKIPKIAILTNKNLYLDNACFSIKNDTLVIEMVNENHIVISTEGNMTNAKIEVIYPITTLSKGERIQQVFKFNNDFKYILFDNKYFFVKCNFSK